MSEVTKEELNEIFNGEEYPIDEDLPEAPMSVNVRGYYKGFSVLFTRRTKNKPSFDDITFMVDRMIQKGFEPSWNKQTSVEQLNGNKPVNKEGEGCQHEVVLKKSNSDKNPGRIYKKCNICGEFLGWAD